MRYKFADREEMLSAGDVFCAPPGHAPVIEAGTEYVEFSHADLLKKIMEVIERDMAAAQKAR